jgi:hypothetical protein
MDDLKPGEPEKNSCGPNKDNSGEPGEPAVEHKGSALCWQ